MPKSSYKNGFNINTPNPVTREECLEALDYLYTNGFVEEMTTDKKHYTNILIKKVANDLNIKLT